MFETTTLLAFLAMALMAIVTVATVLVLWKPLSRLKERDEVAKLTFHDLRWGFAIIVPLLFVVVAVVAYLVFS